MASCRGARRDVSGPGSDRGAVAVLVVVVTVATAVIALVAATSVVAELRAHQRARAAADAAALAGVVDGPTAADQLAAANGAVVVAFERHGDEVVVVVEVNGRQAAARATAAP